jgi:dienelactone hydrolase
VRRASFGRAAAVADGPSLHGVDGIVSLSGELRLDRVGLDAIGSAPRLRAPLLVITANDDGFLDGASARRLVRAAGSARKRAVVVPGNDHGWDLLYASPDRARVLADVLAFVRPSRRPQPRRPGA